MIYRSFSISVSSALTSDFSQEVEPTHIQAMPYLEPTNSSNHFRVLANLLGILMLFCKSYADKPMLCSIRRVFRKYNFDRKSGLLQFWVCSSTNPDSENCGYNLMLMEEPFVSTQDHEGLENYRRNCLDKVYPLVGRETNVGNWLAGRAAQIGIADFRTLTPDYQHSADMGQLVMPVFIGRGAEKKLHGIIELVLAEPKESYILDFEQLQNLLANEGLCSKYIGKTIKVKYGSHMIRFTLPLSAKFTDLRNKVTKRFEELKHTPLCIMYNNTDGDSVPISDNESLGVCLKESSSKAAKLIYMSVS